MNGVPNVYPDPNKPVPVVPKPTPPTPTPTPPIPITPAKPVLPPTGN